MNDKSREKVKKKFVQELGSYPVILAVCKKINIDRSTYYRWTKEDKVFEEACNQALSMGIESINDLAESQLIAGIKALNMKAITYWLPVNSPKYANPKNNNSESTYRENELLERNRELLKALTEMTKQIVILQNEKANKNFIT